MQYANGEIRSGGGGQPEPEVWVWLADPLQRLLQVNEPPHEQVAVLEHQPMAALRGSLQQLQRYLQKREEPSTHSLAAPGTPTAGTMHTHWWHCAYSLAAPCMPTDGTMHTHWWHHARLLVAQCMPTGGTMHNDTHWRHCAYSQAVPCILTGGTTMHPGYMHVHVHVRTFSCP